MKQKRILIFGGTGMFGKTFRESMSERFDIIALSKSDADIGDFPMVLNQISLHEPDIILNFAAMTDVLSAESTKKLEAYDVNALGAQNVAKAASVFGIPLLHLSSDYVFDGESRDGYDPSSLPHPLSHYGISKYLGEELTKRENQDAIIVRTSALYGGSLFGNPGASPHFLNKLLKQKQEGRALSVVSDSYTLPTSCLDLSEGIARLLESVEDSLGGVFHLVSANSDAHPISWYDIALEARKYLPELGVIERISVRDFSSDVERPKYAILNNASNILLPDWKEGIKNYLTL